MKYERGYQHLQILITGSSEKEAHDALNNDVCKDKTHEELVSMGLLTVILTEPHNAAKSYRDLTLVTRDGLQMVLANLSQLVLERWLKLTERCQSQLLWLLRELVRNAVAGVETLAWNLMRLAAGGDISARNIMLIESLLDIYQENRIWLEKYPLLLASVVYTYLRLIEDHGSVGLASLRQKEVVFTVSLLRDKFTECLIIGRDLVRLLQNVARIPEFEQLWQDILHNPKVLSPTFTGVIQMLQSRTSRRFLQSRLTPDMERKMVFLTSSVRFGNHKRYQDWFQRQYLAMPESQTLRCDLIRFIVGVIHPTNELLCSDIIPRWAVIGWLLTTCTSSVAYSNAKLALFYDWLFFESDKDNIMNIEPAILVMHHSMRSHPVVTATLLDFLCRIIPMFYPPLTDKIRQGVSCSLRQILEKRVLPSLYPLFENPKLDRELRSLVRETFVEFCFPPPAEGNRIDDIKEEIDHIDGTPNHVLPNNHVDQTEPAFSDEEVESACGGTKHVTGDDEDDDDVPLGKRMMGASRVRLKDKPFEPKKEQEYIAQGLDSDLKTLVESLHAEVDNEAKCEVMERIVQHVIQEEDGDSDTLAVLGSCLINVLHDQFEARVFPENVTDESLEDSIGRPLFVLIRNLSELSEGDSRRLPLLSLLAEMHSHQPKIGYLLLYYLQTSSLRDDDKVNCKTKAQVYREFCMTLDKSFVSCLLADMLNCQEDDIQMFCWMVSGVYNQFPDEAIGHAELLHLVVSTVDAKQLQELIFRVVQGRLVMFREPHSFVALLSASLNWETFEQFCLWQLVSAHGIPVDYVLPILPRLEYSAHSEALTAILLMLKQERPTPDLVKNVLSRDVKPPTDDFVVSALHCWCRDHEERLGELVAALLSSRCPQTSPNKRKRGGGSGSGGPGRPSSSAHPTSERILGHLDRLRTGCRQFYKLESMQKALQQAQNSCTDAQRSVFSNLFALVEIDESGKGKGRGRKPNSSPGAKTKQNRVVKEVTDSSDESSEEEEIVKPKQAKKRKKVNPVGSDSD
ncbi:integrator complex subunit 3 isoform X2 [Lycorma delicatula]|uniref:integrator complex subunit 3 isoform X2 n=1 Tax=Lycorma delicatula TaxID=130591 RepID=UPI003F50ED8D